MGCSSSRGLGGSTNRAAVSVVGHAVGVHVATGAAVVRGYGELEEKVSGTDASPAVGVGEGVWGQATAAGLGPIDDVDSPGTIINGQADRVVQHAVEDLLALGQAAERGLEGDCGGGLAGGKGDGPGLRGIVAGLLRRAIYGGLGD